METWHFTPKVGISSSVGQINFGDNPEEVKAILGNTCHHMTENAGGTGCSLRLEYNYKDQLIYILFCEGSLIFEEQEIFRITKPELKRYLKKKKFKVIKPDWYTLLGDYCPELCMGFASSKDHGGETNIIGSIAIVYGKEIWDEFK